MPTIAAARVPWKPAFAGMTVAGPIRHLNTEQLRQFVGVRLGAGGQLHRAILSRSFLQDFVLRYDGRTGLVTLSDD